MQESLLLRLALSSVTQLSDTPFKQERESLIAKMQALIPTQHQSDTEDMLQTIQLDVPTRSYATPFIEQFLESARTQQWLSITYRSERGTSCQTIQPQRIYSSAGFWYCEAYSYERQAQRIYRIDRVVTLQSTTAPTTQQTATIHRTQSLPYGHPSLPEVRIQLTARGVLIMERDPHLGDTIQPLGEDGGLLCFRCPFHEYDWLVRTLLSLGPDAQVLAPQSLRQQLYQAARAIAQQYAENNEQVESR
jgi:predicted DNA-binding transcriptional regulator YafY